MLLYERYRRTDEQYSTILHVSRVIHPHERRNSSWKLLCKSYSTKCLQVKQWLIYWIRCSRLQVRFGIFSHLQVGVLLALHNVLKQCVVLFANTKRQRISFKMQIKTDPQFCIYLWRALLHTKKLDFTLNVNIVRMSCYFVAFLFPSE